jgi:hypothetical protein
MLSGIRIAILDVGQADRLDVNDHNTFSHVELHGHGFSHAYKIDDDCSNDHKSQVSFQNGSINSTIRECM